MILVKRTVILLWASSLLPATSALPLLSTIGQQPDLSIFSAIINGTGGKSGTATPALWERFNEVRDRRNYTAFVPIDSAFSKIATPVLDMLVAPRSYELLLSILRTHIAEGLFTTTAEITAEPIRSIEGFELTFTSLDDTTVTLNNQAVLEATSIAADNGVVHKIDQVLNPYTEYFGTSNSTSTLQSPDENRTTIADILAARPELSTLSSVITAIDPQFQTQLASTLPEDSQPNVLFAPSNTAFAQFPPGGLDSLQAPFNQPLSSYLIRHHLANGFVSESDSSLEVGKSAVLPSISGFNITTTLEAAIDGDVTSAFIRVDNAVVEEAFICADNGCVFVIDRFLDPLYLAFGGSL